MYRNGFLDESFVPTCLAPWHCLTVKWGGNVVPDIIYKGKLGNIHKNTLPEILNNDAAITLKENHRNRIIPEVCSNCTQKEKSGRSRRMFFWDKLDYNTRYNSTFLEIEDKPDIRYLDFTLSNKCNLACIHCNSFVSTGWTKDGKKLNKEMPVYWEHTPVGFHGVDINFMNNLFEDPSYFRNLTWVAIRGGEPLYDDHCLTILEWFVDNGLSENIILDISTNATVFDDRFKQIFTKFKAVELMISIEATDELYSIIRGGKYSWDDLNNNLDEFYSIPNVMITFAVTVMITNIFNLDKIWEWFTEHHIEKASLSLTNVVVKPDYLNIAYMPDTLKKLALEKIKNIPSKVNWPKQFRHIDSPVYRTGIDDIVNGLGLEVSTEDQEKYWGYFLDYTADLDKLRDTDTLAYIPEIKDES
jgi:MoaA/NifB/PqqE/SkfB family radical SAM enzyme